MSTTPASEHAPSRPKRRRLGRTLLLGFLVIVTVFLVALPEIVRRQAIQWFEQNGADHAAIEDININVFDGTLEIKGLKLERDKQVPLRVWRLALEVDWQALLHGHAVVHSISLADADLLLQADDKGALTIGGISIPPAPPAPQQPAPAAANDGGELPIHVGLRFLAITETTIRYVAPQITKVLYVDDLYFLDLFSWTPGEAALVSGSLTLDGAPLTLRADTRPFAGERDTQARLQVKQLQLADFLPLAKPAGITDLAGRLTIDTAIDARMRADKRLALTLDGEVSLADLRFANADATLTQSRLGYRGKTVITIPPPADAPLLQVAASVTSEGSALNAADMEIGHHGVTWNGTATVTLPAKDAATPPSIMVDGKVSAQALRIYDPQQALLLAQIDSLELGGLGVAFPQRAGAQSLTLSKLSALNPDTTQIGSATLPTIKVDNVRVNNAAFEFAPQIITVAQVQIDKLQADDTQQGLQLAKVESLSVENVNTKLGDKALVKSVRLEGIHALDSLGKPRAGTAPPPVIDVAELGIETIAYRFAPPLLTIDTLHTRNVAARDKAKQLLLGSIDKVTVNNTRLALDDSASVREITLNGITALDPQPAQRKQGLPPVVDVDAVKLEDLAYRFNPQAASLEVLRISGLHGFVRRNPQGQLHGISPLLSESADSQADATPAAAAADTTKSAEPELQFRLGKLLIGEGSKITIDDQSVKPRFRGALSPLEFTLSNLDSAHPERDTAVHLATQMARDNRITFDGVIQPLNPKPDGKGQLRIDALGMADFSSYSAAAGYNIRSGTLNAEVDYTIADSQLDLQSTWELHKFYLEGAPQKEGAQGGGAAAMPLNVALGLLRDTDDRIRVKVPVTGDVRDPDFSLRHAIGVAFTTAAREGATGYLAYALQPYGAILMASRFLGKAATAMTLQPVAFAPGENTVPKDSEDYLGKIGKLMTERPGVRIILCGSATAADRALLHAQAKQDVKPPTSAQADAAPPTEGDTEDDALLKLAGQRSDAVSEFLQSKHGIASDRLIDCRPTLADDPEAVPQVTLGL